jgi:hypothetical protein
MTLVNPDGVHSLADWCPHSLWREWYVPVVCLSQLSLWTVVCLHPLGGLWRPGRSIVNAACGSTIAMLYASIKAGVRTSTSTVENPAGEVRGQIVGKSSVSHSAAKKKNLPYFQRHWYGDDRSPRGQYD